MDIRDAVDKKSSLSLLLLVYILLISRHCSIIEKDFVKRGEWPW